MRGFAHALRLLRPCRPAVLVVTVVSAVDSEKAVFSITAVNADGKIVGHASFYDDPNLENVPAAEYGAVGEGNPRGAGSW